MLSVGTFASFAMLYVGIGSINSIKKAQVLYVERVVRQTGH